MIAASAVILIGLIQFRRAQTLVARDVGAARAAHQAARPLLIAGFVALSIAMPAMVFTVGVDVPRAQATFMIIVVLTGLACFATLLLMADLRLQDRLRPTPPAATASVADESITYDLTEDDLWRGQMQWQVSTRAGRITLFFTIIAVLAMLVGMPLLTRAMHPRIPLIVHLFPSLVAFGFVGMLLVFFGKRILIATFGRRPGILGRHLLEVRSDGLREATDANDTLWPWKKVGDVTETKEFVLVRVSAIGLFAVPRRAFASDDHVRRFVSAIRHRMGAA